MSTHQNTSAMNFLTVDVEEWFHVFYRGDKLPRDTWESQREAIQPMLDSCLALFEQAGVKATFFFVGWLARRHPHLVRSVADRGHEIASHGFWHVPVPQVPLETFREDIRSAKRCLEDACGKEVRGFRAPGFSIRAADEAALDAVQEAGYRYDSSVLGESGVPYRLRNGLWEVPPNGLSLGSKFLPVNGGFVFRALPLPFYSLYLGHLKRRKVPLNFYVHSWEIWPDAPRISMPPVKYFVQYFNLRRVQPKLRRLLARETFTTIESGLAQVSS